MSHFSIHPRLREDCHDLGVLPATHLLLHKNATLPWFILVPETHHSDLLDLPADQRELVLTDCKRIADFLRAQMQSSRINVAWIGNMVPQLHIHVIGRNQDDPCWPKPVWGHLEQFSDYTPQQVSDIRRDILYPPHMDFRPL